MVMLWGIGFVYLHVCLFWRDLRGVCCLCLLNMRRLKGVVVTVNALTPDMFNHARSFGGVVNVAGFSRVRRG